MQVLLVSDLHFDLRKFDAVLAHVRDPATATDVVVVAGDLLDVGSALPLDAQVTVVLGYLERLAQERPTVVCSGNHDLDHRNEAGEKAVRWLAEARALGVTVDGDSVDLGDWRLTACAWWEGPSTLADLEAALDAAAIARPPRWAWVYHGPPEGPLAWTGRRYYGDPELPRLLERHRPDVVLCGHIHEAPFTDAGAWAEERDGTWLFNTGRVHGDRAPFIELDLERRRAHWWSPVATGSVDLTLSRAGGVVGGGPQ